ncbi:MAG TPA: YkvA family protein [Allosphingosinicella sp.]
MADKPSFLRILRVEVHAAWLAARDPRCPWGARLIGLLVTAYALSPIDLIPDFIPVIGLLDDALLIPAGLWLFVRMLPPGLLDEHRAAAASAAERPRSRLGIAIVLVVWLLCALLAWQLLRWARS